MFKLVVILECDMCGDAFNRMAISTDRNPDAWKYLSATLEARAESACWSCYSAHHCDSCLHAMSCSAGQTADDSVSVGLDDSF
jgi:hypothetical protein